MNQYIFVLNEMGERITSYVDNTVTQEQLLATAKQEYPNAADYIYSADGDSMLDELEIVCRWTICSCTSS